MCRSVRNCVINRPEVVLTYYFEMNVKTERVDVDVGAAAQRDDGSIAMGQNKHLGVQIVGAWLFPIGQTSAAHASHQEQEDERAIGCVPRGRHGRPWRESSAHRRSTARQTVRRMQSARIGSSSQSFIHPFLSCRHFLHFRFFFFSLYFIMKFLTFQLIFYLFLNTKRSSSVARMGETSVRRVWWNGFRWRPSVSITHVAIRFSSAQQFERAATRQFLHDICKQYQV